MILFCVSVLVLLVYSMFIVLKFCIEFSCLMMILWCVIVIVLCVRFVLMIIGSILGVRFMVIVSVNVRVFS